MSLLWLSAIPRINAPSIRGCDDILVISGWSYNKQY